MGASRVEVRTMLVPLLLLLLDGTYCRFGFVNHGGTAVVASAAGDGARVLVGGITNRGSRHFLVAPSEYACMLTLRLARAHVRGG